MSVNWNSSQEIPKPSYTQTEYTHCETKPLGSENTDQNWMLFALPHTSVTGLSHRQVFANRMTTGTFQVWGRWPQIAALGALPSSGGSPGQGMRFDKCFFALFHAVVKQLLDAFVKNSITTCLKAAIGEKASSWIYSTLMTNNVLEPLWRTVWWVSTRACTANTEDAGGV